MHFLNLFHFLFVFSFCFSAYADTELSIVVNDEIKKAKVRTQIDFYPPTRERLEEVVSVLTDVALQNEISEEKRKLKKFPDSLIRTKVSRVKTNTTEFQYLTSVGVSFFKKHVGFLCIEKKSTTLWTQVCDMIADYEDTLLFSDEMSQNNVCELGSTSVRCVFSSEGIAKDFDLGVVARLLGQGTFSHTQMSMLGIESFLENIFTLQIYLESEESKKDDTVDYFYKSSQKLWLTDFMSQMPETIAESPKIYFNKKIQK